MFYQNLNLNSCGGEYLSKLIFKCLCLSSQTILLIIMKSAQGFCSADETDRAHYSLWEIPQVLSYVLEDTTSWWIKTEVCAHICMFPSVSPQIKEKLVFSDRGLYVNKLIVSPLMISFAFILDMIKRAITTSTSTQSFSTLKNRNFYLQKLFLPPMYRRIRAANIFSMLLVHVLTSCVSVSLTRDIILPCHRENCHKAPRPAMRLW